jgi:hypothetical protein
VRPGTLVVVITLLVAMIVFGIFLITFENDESRPEPGRPSPTSVAP